MTFKIGQNEIGVHAQPYVIAEMSGNHNGSLSRALETIRVAKESGANAIKLQTYTADTMTIDINEPDFMIEGGLWDGYNLYELYKWASTPYVWHKQLFEYAKKIGITILSTPFDESAVDLLESLDTPAYKIASFELTDLPLIGYVASKGKPMVISTGMASEIEIEMAIITAREAGCKEIALLHCVSSYPVAINSANLRKIPELAKRFGVPVGLSDHTMGTTASVVGVALGACIIEKHFTLSRADKGPDSEFSIEPLELTRLCTDARDAWLALGSATYERVADEERNKKFRRSIYFVKDLPEGHVLKADDIKRIRPGMGLPPSFYDQLIGRKLVKSVKRGQRTSLELFVE